MQPPVFPLAKKINVWLKPLNESAFMQWLRWAEPNSGGVSFGDMAYEGQAGLGFGLGFYVLFLLLGGWFIKPTASGGSVDLPWEWRLVPWLAWPALGVVLAKVGFAEHIPRYCASYYPLLLLSILLLPRVAALERRRSAAVISGLAMLAVVPVILLTPARPVIPVERLAKNIHQPALETIAAKYHYWAVLRDDLAPLREHLPPSVARFGYAGARRDTAYGLSKPFGSREVVELGLPLGCKLPPPADLEYAVVTAKGLRARYGLGLTDWLNFYHAEIIFELKRHVSLVASNMTDFDTWYLVRFRR